jgi:phosphoribosylaminoimidazole-succinocarboxamide synthase
VASIEESKNRNRLICALTITMSSAVTYIDVPSLPLVARGKVRELYKINDSTLLMAVSDRISAYDVVLDAGIPHKGAILCQISGL